MNLINSIKYFISRFNILERGKIDSFRTISFNIKSKNSNNDYYIRSEQDYLKGEFNTVSIHLYWCYILFTIPKVIDEGTYIDNHSSVKDPIKCVREYGFSYICSDKTLLIHYGIQPNSWTKGDPDNSDHTKVYEWPLRFNYYYSWVLDNKTHMELFSTNHLREWKGIYGTKKLGVYTSDFIELPIDKYDDSFTSKDGKRVYTNFSNKSTNLNNVFLSRYYIDDYDKTSVKCEIHIQRNIRIIGNTKLLRSIFKYIPGCTQVIDYMDFEFEHGVGNRKDSWKGGIIASSIIMKPEETLEECFIRFQKEWNKSEVGHSL